MVPMSPVCSQPSGSIVPAVFLRVVAVAAHHLRPPGQDLAILGDFTCIR